MNRDLIRFSASRINYFYDDPAPLVPDNSVIWCILFALSIIAIGVFLFFALRKFVKANLTLCALAVLTLGQIAHAGTFQWNANAETDIQYYRLYVGTNSGIYTASYLSLGNGTNLTVANSLFVIGRTNYAAMTAVNTSGLESTRYSSEISFVLTNGPPGTVMGFKFIGQ